MYPRLLTFAAFGFAVFCPTRLQGADVDLAVCKPAKNATSSLIYLHGLDTKKPGEQERQNRAMLETLATKHNANLIIPRSTILCKHEKLCWLHEDTAQHDVLFKEILGIAAKCAPTPVPITLLGFSNGGYFSSKAAMLCYPGLNAVIASGSAGQTTEALSSEKRPANCPHLFVTIGLQDITFKKTQAYVNTLKSMGYVLDFKTFKGRHELSRKTLDSVLDQISADLVKKKGH